MGRSTNRGQKGDLEKGKDRCPVFSKNRKERQHRFIDHKRKKRKLTKKKGEKFLRVLQGLKVSSRKEKSSCSG